MKDLPGVILSEAKDLSTDESRKTGVSRRDAVKALSLLPLAGMPEWKEAIDKHTRIPRLAAVEEATAGAPYTLKYFTPHEYQTVRVLVDMILPRDERSGSATDAKVPEFMDTLLADNSVSSDARRLAMHSGLSWIDRECHQRFDKPFTGCSVVERSSLLDDIAWPAKAKPEHRTGVNFFNTFRDLTASGFWSSAMGVKDLQYMGNTFVPVWNGCPPEALAKLGVSY